MQWLTSLIQCVVCAFPVDERLFGDYVDWGPGVLAECGGMGTFLTGVALKQTTGSAIAEGPRDASCQLKSCELPRNSAETTCTTSPEPSISCR